MLRDIFGVIIILFYREMQNIVIITIFSELLNIYCLYSVFHSVSAFIRSLFEHYGAFTNVFQTFQIKED